MEVLSHFHQVFFHQQRFSCAMCRRSSFFPSLPYRILTGISKAACRNANEVFFTSADNFLMCFTQLSMVALWLSECGCTHKKKYKRYSDQVQMFVWFVQDGSHLWFQAGDEAGLKPCFKPTVQTSVE